MDQALIPWAKVDEKYAKAFKKSFKSQRAVSVRMALGALIIQERKQLTDRELVQQIVENPYLQYFLGLAGYQERPPFHHALLTHFRKRLDEDVLSEVNDWIAIEAAKQEENHDDDDAPPSANPGTGRRGKAKAQSEEDPNQGTLILDATCAPADIAYLTDITLLNEAREKLEEIIDTSMRHTEGLMPRRVRIGRRQERNIWLSRSSGALVQKHCARGSGSSSATSGGTGSSMRCIKRDPLRATIGSSAFISPTYASSLEAKRKPRLSSAQSVDQPGQWIRVLGAVSVGQFQRGCNPDRVSRKLQSQVSGTTRKSSWLIRFTGIGKIEPFARNTVSD